MLRQRRLQVTAMGGGGTQLVALDNLVSYWTLDEANGTRSDSHGTNDLSDNNTVTQATGKISNAAQFTAANSEYLSVADNSSIPAGDVDFTMCSWVYLDSVSAVRQIMGKVGTTNGERDYWVYYDNSINRFRFYIRKGDDSNYNNVIASSFGAPSINTWYFVIAWHDKTANTINIQINNGTVDSTAETLGVTDKGPGFWIGRSVATYMDGRVDEASLWGRILTDTERTNLYNGGDGLAYPFG